MLAGDGHWRATGSQMRFKLRRPNPPKRSWVMRQVVKGNAAAEIAADVMLLADSGGRSSGRSRSSDY